MVEILKLMLALVEIQEMKFDQNLCKNFDKTKEVILVSKTQPSGPLCLWQCLYDIYMFIFFPRCIESESEPPTKSTEKFLQYSCYIGERSSLSIRLLLQTLLCSISNAISPQTRT